VHRDKPRRIAAKKRCDIIKNFAQVTFLLSVVLGMSPCSPSLTIGARPNHHGHTQSYPSYLVRTESWSGHINTRAACAT